MKTHWYDTQNQYDQSSQMWWKYITVMKFDQLDKNWLEQKQVNKEKWLTNFKSKRKNAERLQELWGRNEVKDKVSKNYKD